MNRLSLTWRHQHLVLALVVIGAAFVLACAPSVGNSFDDGSIIARVKTALLNDLEVGRRGIEVTSSRGFVRLSGRVQSEVEATKAVLIARNVPGVLDVVSLIQVIP